MHQGKELQERSEQIQRLVERVQALPDAEARAIAIELLQAVMELHGSALSRILEVTGGAGEHGQLLLDKLSRDPLVSGLLALYDLHPDSLETRVGRALQKVRLYVESHGGQVELTSVNDGVVHLRLQVNSHGCGNTGETLKSAVEQAIYEAAPDISRLHVEIDVPTQQRISSFVPLTVLQGSTTG